MDLNNAERISNGWTDQQALVKALTVEARRDLEAEALAVLVAHKAAAMAGELAAVLAETEQHVVELEKAVSQEVPQYDKATKQYAHLARVLAELPSEEPNSRWPAVVQKRTELNLELCAAKQRCEEVGGLRYQHTNELPAVIMRMEALRNMVSALRTTAKAPTLQVLPLVVAALEAAGAKAKTKKS